MKKADKTSQVQFLPLIKPFITLNILVAFIKLLNIGYALIKQLV